MCLGNVHSRNIQGEANNKEKKHYLINNQSRSETENINSDILAVSTQCTKRVLSYLKDSSKKLQNLYYYRLLSNTTQPAHLITLVCAILLAKILMQNDASNASAISSQSNIVKVIYLGSFAAHFGFQIWMTFVSGLALYLNLPRHTFGDVQKVLFPKYFCINAVLSLIILSTFLWYQQNDQQQNNQIVVLVTCFCIEAIIRIYLAPVLVKMISEKNVMETAAGVGMEVGKHNAGDLINCPAYLQLHRTFRRVHMAIAIGNMVTMACTAIHLYHLSSRITI